MPDALVIGGTRFIGRHLVTELLDADYDVTLFNRGNHENPFAEHADVAQVTGDRTSDAALEHARDEVDPEIVVDCVAYYPGEVRMATEVFADADAYVFVSSGSAYGTNEIPKREGETALEPCSDEQAVDESHETYGARKAEGDRAVFEAAEDGVNAMSVRPTIVYGQHDYTGRLNYWTERVRANDRILVPGDGTNIHHLVSVTNVARAIRTVAENGTPGEAYNVGDHRILTLGEVVERIADGLETDVEIVTASERELAAGDLEPADFPLYNPNPHVLSTEKLHRLGWEPVDPADAIAETVRTEYETERDPGPPAGDTQECLRALDSAE
ncbi:SDR family oxidoreductase [Salinarchaeum chitinilyticum]